MEKQEGKQQQGHISEQRRNVASLALRGQEGFVTPSTLNEKTVSKVSISQPTYSRVDCKKKRSCCAEM